MTEKDIFEVVKYFKSIYTFINIKDDIFLSGGSNYIEINYTPDQFFIIYGQLKNDKSNEFLKWINHKNIELNIKEIANLKECLKKNVISLDMDDNKFELKYKDKDGIEKIFLCSVIEVASLKFEESILKIRDINKELGKEIPIDKSIFNNEITEIYLTHGSNPNETKNYESKVFELPSKRIVALLKDATNFYMRISGDRIDNNKQFIEISSSNDLIKLSQIFAII